MDKTDADILKSSPEKTMTLKSKPILISLALAALYVVLSIGGLGVSGITGGFVYRLVIIAALLFSCCSVIAQAMRRGGNESTGSGNNGSNGFGSAGTLLSGTLGLCLLAVSEIYLFAHIYLLQGSADDITVAAFSRCCAYLFFIASAMDLLPNAGRVLRLAVNLFSVAAVIGVFIGVVSGNPEVLYYSQLSAAALCLLLVIFLLIAAGQGARGYAALIISVILLDIINRLLNIFDPGWHWRDFALSLYPTVYLLLGAALLSLKTQGEEAAPINE